MGYVRAKNHFVEQYKTYYQEMWHRKFKWNVKMNGNRSKDEFLNRFQKAFGAPTETVIAIGDWEQRQGISFGKAPTMGIGLRNWFRKRGYRVLLVGEQLTSKTCCKCHETVEYDWKQRPDPRPWMKEVDGDCIITPSQEYMGLVTLHKQPVPNRP